MIDQFGIFLDVVVALLLVATIIYASVLNRKLATLRSTKQEMEAMVGRLVESTEHAENSLAELKSAASEQGEVLHQRVKDAQALADDMKFLIDKGTSLADRLEGQIGKARAGVRTSDGAAAAPKPANAANAAKTANTANTANTADVVETAAPQPEAGGVEVDAAEPAPRRRAAGTAGRTGSSAEKSPPANAKLLKALRGVR